MGDKRTSYRPTIFLCPLVEGSISSPFVIYAPSGLACPTATILSPTFRWDGRILSLSRPGKQARGNVSKRSRVYVSVCVRPNTILI